MFTPSIMGGYEPYGDDGTRVGGLTPRRSQNKKHSETMSEAQGVKIFLAYFDDKYMCRINELPTDLPSNIRFDAPKRIFVMLAELAGTLKSLQYRRYTRKPRRGSGRDHHAIDR
eukprot:SAG22_NODE_557_length_9118_cov_9.050006_3_plen_114_part_00